MKNIILACAAAVLLACGASGQALLENFATARYNYGGLDLLWNAYNGDPDCVGQTWSVTSNVGVDHVPGATGNHCPYAHFFPKGTAGYTFPYGYAQYYILNGSWNPLYNRMTFTMKCGDGFSTGSDGFATYIRDHAVSGVNIQGQHYYHDFPGVVTANQWLTWIVNMHPVHRVGQAPGINWPNDPEWVLPSYVNPTHYFDGLTRFYLNPTRVNLSPAYTCSYSDFVFSQQSGEPDEYVYSLMGSYNGSSYDVAWNGPKM